MKKLITLFAIAGMVLALAPAAQAAEISSTFDSNLESWTVFNDSEATPGTISQVGSGGNPDGYLQLASVAATTSLIAPAAFLGDLSAHDGGTFSWDGAAFDEGSGSVPGSYAYGAIVITGNGTTAYSPFIPSANRPTTAGWSSYSQDFTAANFFTEEAVTTPVTQAAWEGILANVTSITLGGNTYGGFEDIGYDNIALSGGAPASTPGTLVYGK
jgi:hypothetical protein